MCIYWKYCGELWQPTPVPLPGKSHGWRSLVSCSPWGHKESDMTERLHFHFSLSCIGEGNGNPLQCSSLENPRDGGAWWAAIYGVAQSRTRLKWLSSSSSMVHKIIVTKLMLIAATWQTMWALKSGIRKPKSWSKLFYQLTVHPWNCHLTWISSRSFLF